MTNSMMKRLAVLLLAAPLAGCSSLVDNDELGRRGAPSGGEQFASYAALGTSISAGIQSGGINDSTQRETFASQLAVAMGLTPGVDWFYPSFAGFGCPPPFTNPLTGARIGGGTATACSRRTPSSARDFVHNSGIPFLRAQQALDLQALPFPVTDSLKLAQFITGSLNPIDMVDRANPTFVTVEVGANDVLHAATRGDTTLLTPLASYQTAMTGIADRLTAMTPEPNVAIAGIPTVTAIPYLTFGQTFFCLKTGLCGIPANPLFTNMTVDASCAPSPGVGASYALPFPTTAAIVTVLQGGGAANLNCATDVATVTTGAGTAPAGATLSTAEFAAINQRVADMNTFLTQLATQRGYAFVDLAAVFAANAAQIPSFPNFTNPSQLFGTLFSLDGVHPTKAGHRLLAQAFAAAINTTYGSSLTIP